MSKAYVIFLSLLYLACSPAYAGEMVADEIQQDVYGMVSATGHVKLKNKTYEVKAKAVQFDVDAQTVDMQDATIRFGQGYTLKGESLKRIDLKKFSGKEVSFSTCPDDEQAWAIVADEATLDREAGNFSAKNAWFEVGGVPLFYTPRWSSALTRRSGFLMPELGTNTIRGEEVTVPLYWAGAPSWDVTLRPRWMSLRGVMSDVKWRHRSATSTEMIQIQSILDQETQKQRGRVRSNIAWQPYQSVQVKLNVDAVGVDDGFYIADFPLLGEKESTAYLTSTASVGWREAQDSVVLSSRYQQRLGGISNAGTLQILPRLETRNYFDTAWGPEIKIEQQTTSFERQTGYLGLRSGVRPSVAIPWNMQGGAVSAVWSIQGQAVGYDTQKLVPTSSSYMALASSAQLQAVFERISAGKTWRHELKPIIRLDVSSAPNQGDLPRYDSSLIPLSMTNILQGNRYSGWDRFERMRRVSALLVSSLQHKSEQDGVRTVLQGQVGMVWDDLGESVDASIAAPSTRRASNLLAEATWFPNKNTRVSVGGQHSPDLNQWVESHASMSWTGQGRAYFNMGWQRTDVSHSRAVESINANGRVNISRHWASYVSTQYDLLRDYALNTVAGIDYQHACWSLKIEGFKTYRVGTADITDEGTRFLLAFDGLGSFADE